MRCRFCNTLLKETFVDLINAPLSNAFLNKEELNEAEIFYPLKLYVCHKCLLVQVNEYKSLEEVFNSRYVYFSSYSVSWLAHSKTYVDMITNKLSLNHNSHVMEIASNDGYLLQYFKEKKIPCLGVEPTANTVKVAREKGLEVIETFFCKDLAKTLKKSDLILGNNVLAHVPDINDFVKGLKIALKAKGAITMEFPHLLTLISENQFDTIYHEHFSYFSFFTVKQIFETHNLKLYDVEKLTTHGGSLRIYATHEQNDTLEISKNVAKLLHEESIFGISDLLTYRGFQKRANKVAYDFLAFLLNAKKEGKKVAAYGAAAKGNTLLNYAGIKRDLIAFVVDRSPHKQGKYLPASHIPVVVEERLKEIKPEYIVILPWNIKEEIFKQLEYVKEWGCQFVVAIPQLEII